MPKRPPDQVITHRIELGEYERQNGLKPYEDMLQVKTVLNGLGAVGVGFGIAVAGYSVYWLWQTLYGIGDKIEDFVADGGDQKIAKSIPFVGLWYTAAKNAI